jgi:CheY-like chemotaxis protein
MEQPESRDKPNLILIIDDHKDTCLVVERLLRSAGFLAECITSPLDALERLQTVTPAAMLLDIMMPEMSGIELLSLVRTNPKTAHIPVLMMTATSNEEDLRQASRLGARDIIPKGRFDWSQLPDRLRPYVA